MNKLTQQLEQEWVELRKLRESEQPAQQCRTDGRCQYAIDSGAEGMGHCPKGKCVLPAQQEPFAWADLNALTAQFNLVNCGTAYRLPGEGRQPLYTSTPAQRKPLTDEQIEQIFKENAGYSGNDFISFARAIEAAHVIKENT